MCRRPRPRAVLVVLVGALLAAGGSVCATAASGSNPLSLTAAFDRGATLGSGSALDVTLRLDPRRFTRAQLTEVRFAYPRTLGIVSSGLGLASCTPSPDAFARVLIDATGLGGCPANAVMGVGSARALVRLTNGQVIPEYATVTLLAGALQRGRLGLVVYVDGQRPFGGKLAFAGEVRAAAAPYGGALTVRMPVVPGIEDVATISLVELRITIGSRAIRYYERRQGRTVAYRPEGVQLPVVCPGRGFRFRAQVGFSDGSRSSVSSITPCPRAVASPPTAR